MLLLGVGEWGLENAKSSKEKTTLEDALLLLTAVAVWLDGLVALFGATAGAGASAVAGAPSGCVCRWPSAISGGDEYGAVVGDWTDGGVDSAATAAPFPRDIIIAARTAVLSDAAGCEGEEPSVTVDGGERSDGTLSPQCVLGEQ